MTTKEYLLSELLKTPGKIVSGEKLANDLSVSRTAVWKAVQSLRKEGHNITSGTNNGYCLNKETDLFSTETVTTCLKSIYKENNCGTPSEFPKISVFNTLDSTNSEAKRIATSPELSYPSVILAEQQTAGRGRLGRCFYSPSKSGIYLSILYKPKNPVTEPSVFTATAAVGVCHAISEVFSVEAGIKWVNDIFLGGRKVCGILTEGIADFETNSITTIIIGIGINITDSEIGFPEEISKVAGSIISKTEKNSKNTISVRSRLAASVIYHILKLLDDEESDSQLSVINEYKQRSIVIGKDVNIIKTTGETSPAVAIDIDENAHLIVQKPDGTKLALQSGEVSLSSSQFAN